MFGDSFSFGEMELLITNIGFIISIIITVGTGFVVLFKSSRREVKIPFFLFTVTYAIFMISHIAGINASSTEVARKIFMFNMNNVFIVVLVVHWITAAVGELQSRKRMLLVLYTLAVSQIALFLLFPYYFLKGVKPILYFPNYYDIGPLYPVMTIFILTCSAMATYVAWKAYSKAQDGALRKRMFYFFIMPVIGYPLGIAPAVTIYYPHF